MSDTLLKKDFKESDVQRIRNLIKKDYTGRTKITSGYTGKVNEYKEGDIWEEDGRTWTIKNGVRQNISKLKQAKDFYKMPLTCPKCGGSMKHHLHKKMYRIHKFCFDCTIDYEANLRKLGKYEEYEKAMITGNILSFASDLESFILDSLEQSTTFVTEQGDIEDWKNNSSKNKEKILTELAEFTKHVRNSLK